jgi:hypothetical protein
VTNSSSGKIQGERKQLHVSSVDALKTTLSILSLYFAFYIRRSWETRVWSYSNRSTLQWMTYNGKNSLKALNHYSM